MITMQTANADIVMPESANLPVDVLRAIPYEPVENSKTGDAPKNLWQQIVSRFTNLVIGVANFIKNGLIAIGEFLAHAAEVVAKFELFLAKTIWSSVNTAVTIIKKDIEKLGNILFEIVKGIFQNILKPVIDGICDFGNKLKKAIEKGIDGTLTPENLAMLIVGIIVCSAVFIGIMTLIGSLAIINTVTNLVSGGGAVVLSQFAGGIAKMLIGFFVAMAATQLVGITVDECLKQAEDATKGTFELADFVKWFGFYLASKTRTLKSVQEVAPVGLGVALLGIVIFAAKKMVVTGTDKLSYGISLAFDAMSIGLLVYAKTKFKNYPWVARWYKIMDIAQDVLEIVGLAGVVTDTIEDIHRFITAG